MNDITDGYILDFDYFLNRSGNKIVSPIIDKILTGSDVLSDENINNLADLIFLKFKVKWEHLYKLLQVEYNPIDNYSMTENSNDIREYSDNDTITHGQTITNTVNSNGESTSDIYGFNSGSSKPADKSTATSSGNSSEVHGGKDETVKTGSDSNTHSMTRKGNIGVTTTQNMMQQEIALWQWNFFDTVYEDIDKILTISIY